MALDRAGPLAEVRVLTAAVDELTEEVQWRNHNVPVREATPPFLLRSMPADPCAADWTLNRVPPERVAELRQQAVERAPAGRLFD